MASRRDLTKSFADVSSLSERRLQDLFEENSSLLESLPDEVIVTLLSKVPTEHLPKFCRVSHRVNQLCNDHDLTGKIQTRKESLKQEAKRYFFTWSIHRLLFEMPDPEHDIITIGDGSEDIPFTVFPNTSDDVTLYIDSTTPAARSFVISINELIDLLMRTDKPTNYVTGSVDGSFGDAKKRPYSIFIPSPQYPVMLFDRNKFIKYYIANPKHKEQLDRDIHLFTSPL